MFLVFQGSPVVYTLVFCHLRVLAFRAVNRFTVFVFTLKA